MDGQPLDPDSIDEFLVWIEGETFSVRRQQGRLSTFGPAELTGAFAQAARLLRVPLETVQTTFLILRKQHRDPTLAELVDRIREEEAKRLQAAMEEDINRLVKEVHKITLVRKSDIRKVYESMLDVNARLPTRDTLALQVREVFYNEYPHLRVKMMTGP